MNSRIKKIAENRDVLEKKQSDISKGLIKLQHSCTHNVDGDANRTLRICKKDDKVYARCTMCGKLIEMKPPKVEEFKAAVKTIEDGIDYLKMVINDTNTKGDEIVGDCADALNKLTNITKMYDNLASIGGGHKKNKNNDRKRTAYTLTNRSVLS